MRRFRSILVAVDTRLDRHPALEWATHLARSHDCPLRVVTVLPNLGWRVRLGLRDGGSVAQAFASVAQSRLQRICIPSRAAGVAVSTAVLVGKTSRRLIEEVDRGGHDVVVAVSRGRRSSSLRAAGTTGLRLMRRCPCAVWLVPPRSTPRFARVLSALRGGGAPRSGSDLAVAELGHAIATPREAQLHVHTTGDEIAPWRAICARADETRADLLIMGSDRRRGLREVLLGDPTEEVLERARCAVLVLRPNRRRAFDRLAVTGRPHPAEAPKAASESHLVEA